MWSEKASYLNLPILYAQMTFDNDKKTFLLKQDKSKKGDIDEKVKPLLAIINSHPDYYTTSSCSGRVYLWQGSGKKNETEWLKVSHDLIDDDFLKIKDDKGLVWLRLEPLIMHICCKDRESANRLLELARRIYKKSAFLSISSKIILEIRGSEFLEMPFYNDGKLLFNGDLPFLKELINDKMNKIHQGREKLEKILKGLKQL